MADGESPQEFLARMRSIQHIRGGRTKAKEKVITRPEHGNPALGENKLDAGKRAKVTINEERDLVYTTSDNRQDANIFGTAARASGAGGEL
jgi:phosphoserine phosphatase